jgi:hypothetical protein
MERSEIPKPETVTVIVFIIAIGGASASGSKRFQSLSRHLGASLEAIIPGVA